MQITTYIEELNKQESLPLHTEEGALQGIKEIFAGALQQLASQMAAEEEAAPCNLTIHILPAMEEWGLDAHYQDQGLRATINGYSEELAIKIQQAIEPVLQASRRSADNE